MADPTPGAAGHPQPGANNLSVLKQYFDESAQRELLEDDRIAWRNVCGILFSIVAIGVLLGATGVMLAFWN
ncbi:MAG: hypothetical protein GTO03_13515 [Planctomycetales bacterium]|nr:hypothetical protein [Planctomycetales bacterium]